MSNKKNKTKSVPMRRCIGCMESKMQSELTRIAFYEGELSIDRKGKAKGRGVYLCKNSECIAAARKKNAIQRGFKTNLSKEEIEKVFEEIENE